MGIMKKRWSRIALAAAIVLAASVGVAGVVFARAGGLDGINQRHVTSALEQLQSDEYEDGRIHVFTLGTGSPQPGSHRLPAANLVIAGSEYILIDAGEGASRTMSSMFLPVDRIGTVFLTHLHSDHIGGLGQVLNESWNSYRDRDVDVYGPPGVAALMDGLALVYGEDIDFRSADEVERNDPQLALATARQLNVAPEDGLVRVFDRNGVTVDVFHVDHGHVEPSYGYRIEYNGRSAVFSGDTIATPLMLDPARDADVLFHEAVNLQMMDNAIAAYESLGDTRGARRAAGVAAYHADTIGVAKIAEEANVGKLVLTHLIPDPSNPIAKWLFTRGMDDYYGGDIVISEDGMRFSW